MEEYEVVLGDGSVVKASRYKIIIIIIIIIIITNIKTSSRDENSDLYHCLPWSHGSLAFLVGLKLKIIPTKPYIHMK